MLNTDDKIKTEIGDAPDFIKSINNLITTLIDKYKFDEVFIIQINNWFDHRWLNYSGKSVVQFHGGYFIESTLENEWREKVTIPPFNPNRILSEKIFNFKAFDKRKFVRQLHSTKASNDNLHNRITDYSNNGLFIWYSSDTEKNQKGSIMVYKVQNNIVDTFYISFENNKEWKVKRTKNIPANEIIELLNPIII